MATPDEVLLTEVGRQLAAHRDELVNRLGEALQATLFSNRAFIRPALLKQIAAEEADAFLTFLKEGDTEAVRTRGAKRTREGLGEPSALHLGVTMRRFCLTHLEGDLLRTGLEATEAYTTAFLEGFMEAREAIVLDEQEHIRAALQRALDRYTIQLQAAAEIAQVATSILDLNELLSTSVELIRNRFDFYYVGIFLVDEYGEWAILRAGTGEPGREMLRQGHKLKVGGKSMIGWCTAHGQARVAFDVGKEAVHFDNPLLPDTRSEMALPLISRGRVIGGMTIQSTRVAAFSDEDITLLKTIADQLANAIENARLFAEVQARIKEVEASHRRYMHEEWARFLAEKEARCPTGYAYEQSSATAFPIGDFWRPEIEQAVQRQEIVALTGAEGASSPVEATALGASIPLPPPRSALAAPLTLRGEVIGALGLYEVGQDRQWSEDDIALVEEISVQVAQAIENARLFEATERSLAETRELFEASRAIGAATSPSEVGKALVSYAATTDLDVARLILYEFVEGELVTAVLAEEWTADGQAHFAVGASIPMTDFGLERLHRPEEVIVVEDIHTDDWLDGQTLSLLEVAQLRSVAFIPLAVGGRQIGQLLVGHRQPASFPERLIRNLQTLGSQAAIALENLRLLEETRRRAHELEVINELGRAITSVLDLDVLIRQIVDTTKERFGHYFVSLLLVEGDQLVLRDGSTIGDTGRRLESRSFSIGLDEPGLVTEAVRTARPVLVNDVLSDPRYRTSSELEAVRSELDVPIEVKGRVVGVLDVQSDRLHAYRQADVLLLQSLAAQAGVAIENARLFAETEAIARRRALISEVLQAAATSLDPEELLHRAGETIARNMGIATSLFLWEEKTETFRPLAVHAADGSDVLLPEDVRITADVNPFMFQAVEQRRPQTFEVRTLSGPCAELAHRLQARFGVCVPLFSRGRIFGMLSLLSPQELTSEAISFAQIIGANLGIVLDNAYLYQEAVETAERLKEVDRLKSQFLANMSHELRTPLNSIIGFSRVILKGIDGPITDMQRQDLEAIYNSGQHLLGLINDILDISKIEAGKMELSFQSVDLREVIRGVMSTAVALVKDKPIELQQSIPEDLPTIVADERRIRQVLLNLVSNAAKFTDEGFIHVEATYDDEYVTISVADSGIGIPAEKVPKIFEAFTQVDASPSRKYGGTGLGLTISRSFIELHGGRIWVESEPGRGSTFTFTLPIQGPPKKPREEEEPAAGKPEEVGGKRLLCVDDDRGVITLFRRYLSKQGYQVIGLTDPSRAVEEAKRLKPYAITLDVMMPGKDGWQVIQELKADPETRDIPVIMCTIVGEKGRGMSLGAADYLVKPILEQDLLAALDRLDREAGRHRVLIVDDQEEDRNLLRRIIESQEGYEVIEAANGQDAIALVHRARPHIIILDLLMPEVDGFAVLEAVKTDETSRSIPIIVVTAKELTEEDRQLLNHRIEALIQKGVLEQEELLEDVAAALRKLGRVS